MVPTAPRPGVCQLHQPPSTICLSLRSIPAALHKPSCMRPVHCSAAALHTSSHLQQSPTRPQCTPTFNAHVPLHHTSEQASSRAVHASAKGSKAADSASASPASRQPQPDDAEEDELFFDLDEDEFEEYEEGEDGEYEEGEEPADDGSLLGLEVDDTRPGVDTSGMGWAEGALKATNKVLSLPSMSNLELYVFRALPGNKLDIRLDRLDDTYGSPSIDDIEKFSRMLFLELDAVLGTDAASDISLEVSSPGAERTLQLPRDLERFSGLPLYIEYKDTDAKPVTSVLIMGDLDLNAGTSVWRLADVKANAPVKGRKLSKRQRELQIEIPVGNITLARVHVDF